MGFFKKLTDVLKANLNSALEKAEDPEKMASLALLELEEKKKRTNDLIVAAIARLKIAQKSSGADAEVRTIEEATIDTLKKGVAALTEKIAYLKASNAAYSAPVARANIEKTDAFDTFTRMEQKIEDKEAAIQALTTLLSTDEKKEAANHIPAAKSRAPLDAQALEKELEDLRRSLMKDS